MITYVEPHPIQNETPRWVWSHFGPGWREMLIITHEGSRIRRLDNLNGVYFSRLSRTNARRLFNAIKG